MFKLHREQCNSCLYLTETEDWKTGKSCDPVCGWSIASFKGETKNKCNHYELDKEKSNHGIPNAIVNAFER